MEWREFGKSRAVRSREAHGVSICFVLWEGGWMLYQVAAAFCMLTH